MQMTHQLKGIEREVVKLQKGNIIKAVLSLGLLALVFTITFLIVGFNKEEKQEVEVDMKMSSSIVSTNPRQSAANFITFNGTMGDLTKVNQSYFSKIQEETNGDRRSSALNKVKSSIVDGSPLLSERTEEHIKERLDTFFIFYKVSNVKTSEPSEMSKISISHNAIGEREYEAVEVQVDFTSSMHGFYWPTDMGGDSIIKERKSSEKFEDIKVTLIKNDGEWYIYDVEDSEYLLNSRMATWQGIGENTAVVDPEVINEYTMDYEVK